MIEPHPTTRSYRWMLGVIIGAAALLRFAMAPNLALESRDDSLLFQLWGYSVVEHGVTNVYTTEVGHPWFKKVPLPNYLPPYLYVVGAIEKFRRVVDPSGNVGTPTASFMLKSIPILFELATVFLLAQILRRRGGDRLALLGALAYAFHPALAFITAGWGQVDAVYTFGLVAILWLLERGKHVSAAAVTAATFLVKMQTMLLVPLLIYELIRTKRIRTMVAAVGAALGTAAALVAPFLFAGKGLEVLKVITNVAGSFPHPSANAHNLWWLFSGGHWQLRFDTEHVLGLPMYAIGATLYIAAIGFALWFRHRVRTPDGLWLTAALLALAFFMLPTEMHERYLFSFFALLLPACAALQKARWLYLAVAVTFTWNILVAFLVISHDAGFDRFEDYLGNYWGGSRIVAALNVLLFAGTVVWYARMARRKQTL